jgi:hypothetical protein
MLTFQLHLSSEEIRRKQSLRATLWRLSSKSFRHLLAKYFPDNPLPGTPR